MNHPLDILKTYWGYDHFRAMQEEVIRSVIDKKDTLALMPTGGGKSLCYQVPGLMLGGLSLVISPLIALMKDQVQQLRRRNITAYAIHTGMSRKEVIQILKTATESNCRFLYVSPERLETALFKEYLPALDIRLLAVDEAHCISQWGYDFRPPYLRIAALREELPDVPVLALTASATPEVQEDICARLGFKEYRILRQGFERPNLSYSVFQPDAKIQKLKEILHSVPGTAIVYCRSRKRTKEISNLLLLEHISADFYHAGLNQEERNRKQEDWIANKTRVIVCTNAFGMGIDKPDVRSVIHMDVPDCLENYYQEAGRAGRDGKKSYAVLLYTRKDLQELKEQAVIRFPVPEDIRKVYESLCNFFQLPSGSGEGLRYDFDFRDFVKKFQLNNLAAMYALKALEQEEWLLMTEQVFQPSAVQFITGKEMLFQFEKDHPDLEPLIKTLLRSYEGIFDHRVPVSEYLLARLLEWDKEDVSAGLQQLHRYQVVEFLPQKEQPQVQFLKNRVRKEDLQIHTKAYEERKHRFNNRVNQMIGYAEEPSRCRSRITGTYFGDTQIQDCGICDNCLKKKSGPLQADELENVYLQVRKELAGQQLEGKELITKIKGVSKEKAWKAIAFLQAENKIEMDKSGFIRLSR